MGTPFGGNQNRVTFMEQPDYKMELETSPDDPQYVKMPENDIDDQLKLAFKKKSGSSSDDKEMSDNLVNTN